MLTIHPNWESHELSAEIARLRREDPAYDKAWRDGLQRMADEWDARCAQKIEMLSAQRAGMLKFGRWKTHADRNCTDCPKPGDVITFDGVYVENPAPEVAHATITGVTQDGDDTLIAFVAADEDSAALLRKWDSQRTGDEPV